MLLYSLTCDFRCFCFSLYQLLDSVGKWKIPLQILFFWKQTVAIAISDVSNLTTVEAKGEQDILEHKSSL